MRYLCRKKKAMTTKTTNTTPYLVSDRAFRVIITEVIERLCLECADPDCFHAVIHLVRNYLKTGEITAEAIRLTPHEGYRIFLMFQDMINKSIRRSRSARATGTRRKEKKAEPARKKDTHEDNEPFRPDRWPPQSQEEPSEMVKRLKEIYGLPCRSR